MDLLDLYHAHDLSLADDQNEEGEEVIVNFGFGNGKNKNIEPELNIIRGEHENPKKSTHKKPKFIPWEPYKAAVTSTPTKKPPVTGVQNLPELISYAMQKRVEPNNNETHEIVLKDERRRQKSNSLEPSEKEHQLEEEIKQLREDLSVEQKVNNELKRLMIATLNDELQGQVEALTTDKVRLAHRVDEYMGKLIVEDEESDRLRIDRDVWKCKFLAQSIRCDELTSKNEYLLKTLVNVQNAVKANSVNAEDTSNFAKLDLQPLFHRSPCEERVQPIKPKFTNLTISCCKNCSGREIQLL